jgi:hypothetical protein
VLRPAELAALSEEERGKLRRSHFSSCPEAKKFQKRRT